MNSRAELLTDARRAPDMAGSVCVKPDFALFAARIRAEATDNWDDKVAVDRFVGQGGLFGRGSGRLVGSGTVLIEPADSEGESVRMAARRGVVLATGTQPSAPPIPGLAKTVRCFHGSDGHFLLHRTANMGACAHLRCASRRLAQSRHRGCRLRRPLKCLDVKRQGGSGWRSRSRRCLVRAHGRPRRRSLRR